MCQPILASEDVNAFLMDPCLTMIKRIKFEGKSTIVFWNDGTTTVVKCSDKETDNRKIAIMWAMMKKKFGSSLRMNRYLEQLVENAEK